MPTAARASLALYLTFNAGYFLSYFLRSANAVLAPDLMRDVGLGPADLGLMTALFFGAYAGAQVPIGLALDRWGPRGVATVLMLLGAVGALLFAIGETFATLAVGRVLIGVGTGSSLLGGLKAFALWWPAKQFATISGVYFASGSLGALLAAAPLAWMNEGVGWRAVFMAASVVVALLAALVWWRTPPVVHTHKPTAKPAVVEEATVDSARTRATLTWAIVGIAFLGAAHTGPVLAFQTLWGGPYLFDAYAVTPALAGAYLLVLSLGVSVGYATSGMLADRFGLQRVTVLSALVFTAAQWTLAVITPGSVHIVWMFPLYAWLGWSGGYCVLVLSNARALLAVTRSGRATGIVNAGSIGGVFLMQWGIGLVVEAAGGPHGYQWALAGTGSLTLVALLFHLLTLRGWMQQKKSPEATA